MYEPVYSLGLDIPGYENNSKKTSFIDRIAEETVEEYKFRRDLDIKKK